MKRLVQSSLTSCSSTNVYPLLSSVLAIPNPSSRSSGQTLLFSARIDDPNDQVGITLIIIYVGVKSRAASSLSSIRDSCRSRGSFVGSFFKRLVVIRMDGRLSIKPRGKSALTFRARWWIERRVVDNSAQAFTLEANGFWINVRILYDISRRLPWNGTRFARFFEVDREEIVFASRNFCENKRIASLRCIETH